MATFFSREMDVTPGWQKEVNEDPLQKFRMEDIIGIKLINTLANYVFIGHWYLQHAVAGLRVRKLLGFKCSLYHMGILSSEDDVAFSYGWSFKIKGQLSSSESSSVRDGEGTGQNGQGTTLRDERGKPKESGVELDENTNTEEEEVE